MFYPSETGYENPVIGESPAVTAARFGNSNMIESLDLNANSTLSSGATASVKLNETIFKYLIIDSSNQFEFIN